MRKINTIVFHCSASDNPKHDDISVITQWHKARGWKTVGYHYFIKKDGSIQKGRPIESTGAHVMGHNADTIGICFSGEKQFTKEQMAAAHIVLTTIARAVGKTLPIKHHRDYTNLKTCPNFVLQDFLKGKLTLVV